MSSIYDLSGNKTSDIINLKHYEPKNHVRMSKESRAGQFSPFSAL